MKKVLLFLAVVLIPALSAAQTCERDSNILKTGGLLSPAPWSPDSPFYNLKLACINEPYNQSVTVNVPTSITLNGITVPITNVSIPTTNGIGNYPAGLTYLCDPPNCVFNAGTLGCILLYGTPSVDNPVDTFDMAITATVQTPFGPVPVVFPGNQAAPDDHYYLILRPTGECASSAGEAGSPFSSVRNLPNPFGNQTVIEVQSTQSGVFRFQVFDLLGNRVHSETLNLYEGANQITYDASHLPAGTYLYSIGNASGQSVRRMVKN
ncbi:MAG: T9SS type A sorting domain-containing protein [Thermoanaerobaculia bacterium]|nr:T9SS type A sorting domain-containing protein [Thermoanaerobaculia bacterium]